MATLVPSHGVTFQWGSVTLHVTGLQVSAQSGGEIDITSMSSEVVTDPENSRRKLIVPDFDAAVSARYGTEVSVEFLAGVEVAAENFLDVVGSKRLLTVSLPRDESGSTVLIGGTPQGGFRISKNAIMTQLTLTASTGDFVKGSATFRITGL